MMNWTTPLTVALRLKADSQTSRQRSSKLHRLVLAEAGPVERALGLFGNEWHIPLVNDGGQSKPRNNSYAC
jgi:hypothetical protein